MIKESFKAIYSQPLLLINSTVEGILGLWMMIAPSSIQTLGSVEIPFALIQTCGLLALSVAAFSKLGAIYIYRSKDPRTVKLLVYSSLAIFHSALTIGLVYAAILGDINYLGAIIHLPLAVAFIVSNLTLNKSSVK